LAAVIFTVIGGYSAVQADLKFATLVEEIGALCEAPPATRCSHAIHRFLDGNADGKITFDELDAARGIATQSAQDKDTPLTPEARGLIGLALIGLKSAGAKKVFATFDANGDQSVSHDELFADFHLDSRSFAVVAADENAVAWSSLAGRFGKLGQVLLGMVPGQPAR
jgi:hypothetical protein